MIILSEELDEDEVYEYGGLWEPSRNFECSLHNCCYGLDNKLHRLNVMLDDWQRFMALSEDSKISWKSSWNVPQNCSSVERLGLFSWSILMQKRDSCKLLVKLLLASEFNATIGASVV
ncbi:hypothetical protein MKW98_031381 [Papaver atlanticum]|uniref:Uncharacterized protein n=1 Tax=Papaver atlanticum TaxID=357466 RepID=A0AAD4S556_9MAGN|nr:hypothetical protein MKW98_031381 [Papaver atlanticum]